MKTSKQLPGFSRTIIALAVLAAFSPVHAQDAEIAQLITPSSSASVGLGAVSGDSADRAIFGQYNGLRKHDVVGLFDLDYVKRDDASATWMNVKAANLGLDTRELSFSREKQGDWKYSADYSELTRVYPRTINTSMTGIGSTTPNISYLPTIGSGSNVDLQTERKAGSLGFEKWISSSLQFEGNFKSEDKTGARLFGRGYDCAAYVCGPTGINQANFVKNAFLLVPEAIDSTTKQIDAKFNFHDDKLLVSAGYYGSFYNNANGNLSPTVQNRFNNGLGQPLPGYTAVAGGTSLQNVLQLPMALPPDNQAHQVYLDGSYSLSPKTKANFKIAYSHAQQDDNFLGNGLTGAPVGSNSLNAKVDTTLAQLGFSSRPMDKLSILGNVRYEHKDDKTPTALYNIENTTVWNNGTTSSTKVAGKLEASYRLPANFRGTFGVDYNSVEREVPTSLADDNVAGLGALRGKTEEKGYRAELRRNMSETLNGAISYSSSKRNGSDWTSLSTLNPVGASAANLALINAYCNGLACYGQQLSAASILGLSATTPFPLSMTDLERDKWKLSADWNPTERLSLQFIIENGTDKNTAPFNAIAGGKGWRESAVKLYSVDASFALSDGWSLAAYASHGDQTQHINHSTGYMADLNNLNDTAGLSLTGKLSSKLQVGGNLSYMNDVNKYGLDANSSATGAPASAANLAQAAIGLPNVTFRQLGLKLFGKYALNKKADVRVDLIHQRVKFNEWTWGNNGTQFAYADNTTLNMQPDQKVTFVGVTYIYKF